MSANGNLSELELLKKWRDDEAGRAEAAALEAHRRRFIKDQYDKEYGSTNDEIAKVTGVEAVTKAGKVKG